MSGRATRVRYTDYSTDAEETHHYPACGGGTNPRVLEVALHYAELGYKVLPIEPAEKRPHHILAPRGIRDASRNHLVIRSWFEAFPDCNLALTPPEGVAVLDFDSRAEAERFLARFPELVHAPRSLTPRGVHLWGAVPVGVELRAKSPRGLPPCEVKRPGKGYLLEYPSKTALGSYTWMQHLVRPSELPPTPLDLLRALAVTSLPKAARGAETQDYERVLLEFHLTATPGNRHNRFIAIASRLRAAAAPDEILDRLAQAALELGLPPHEVQAALRWVEEAVKPQAAPVGARSARSLFYLARKKILGGNRDR